MSLENARKHWRFLAAIPLILLIVAVVGPLIFYAIGYMISRYGTTGLALVGLFMAVFLLIGIFSIAWLTGKPADRTEAGISDDREAGGNG